MSTDTNSSSILSADNNNNDEEIATAEAMREQLAAIEIPPNIDSRLLELWLHREHQEIERREKREKKRYASQKGHSLGRIFAAFTGIVVMILMIILGLVQGKETNDILTNACIAFLVYTIIGFFIGFFVEGCVANSVEDLIREIIKRTEPTENNNDEIKTPET
ncbi:MAG: hypothetical protein LBB88_09185 [Planctomycetaceae bacterium]|jgi:F0F1-type ATP synthase assembly protein I|nr:hypothetical protein [Planctomycetaceae bacterium]